MRGVIFISLSAFMLLSFGLMMLLSIAPEKVLPQVLSAVFSLLVGWVVFRLGVKNILPFAWLAYIGILVLLSLTLLFGKTAKGSSRWLKVGGFQLQASELAKPVLLLVTIKLVENGWPVNSKKKIKLLVKYISASLFPFGLVLAQPDLGSALVFPPMIFSLLYASNLDRRFFISVFVMFMMRSTRKRWMNLEATKSMPSLPKTIASSNDVLARRFAP